MGGEKHVICVLESEVKKVGLCPNNYEMMEGEISVFE
jgi:hypothetical protein